MSTTDAAPRPTRPALGGRALLCVGAAALATLLLRAYSYTGRILDRDEAYWTAAARRMADFDLPLYVAGWETKPPLVLLLHAAGQALLPADPLLATHALAAAVAAATTALAALAGARLAGTLGAALSGGLYALLDSTGQVKWLAAGCEGLAALPIAGLVALLVLPNRRFVLEALLVGVLTALAGLAKQPALIYGPLACVVLAVRNGRVAWSRAAVCVAVAGAACLVTLGLAAGWLVAAGSGEDARICLVDLVAKRAEFAGSVAGSSTLAPLRTLALANSVTFLGVLLLFGAAATGRWRLPAARGDAVLALACLLGAGVLAAIAGGMGFAHYWRMAHPPLAVAGAAGILAAFGAAGRRARVVAVAALALALLAAAPDRRVQRRSARWPGYESPAVAAVAEAVRSRCAPDEPFFVWGMHPDLYLVADRACSSRITSCAWLVGSFRGDDGAAPEPMTPRAYDLLLEDLRRYPPRVVVDSAPAGVHGFDAFPLEGVEPLRAWLEAGYVRVGDVGLYRLYERR